MDEDAVKTTGAVTLGIYGDPLTLPSAPARLAFWPLMRPQLHILYFPAVAAVVTPA